MDPRLRAFVLAVGLLACGSAARATPPGPPALAVAVARGYLRGTETAGMAFFLPIPGSPGAVAVGSARTFDRTLLAESGRVVFRIAGSSKRVAVSTRFFAAPGRSYHAPGSTLRDDYAIFTLEAPPEGIRILEAAPGLPAKGTPVVILGSPRDGMRQQTELHARVMRAERNLIELQLDGIRNLRGLGGAPVLDAATGRVVGLLESALPVGGGMRLGVGPIGGVLAAMQRPYEGGLGRLFATLAPPASAATSMLARRRAVTHSAFGALDPGRSAAEVIEAANRAWAGPRRLAPARLRVEIEHPAEGSSIGDAAGAFLAGRALALRGAHRRFDLVVVIDTSASTAAPAGVDVDGDGQVGKPLGGGNLGSSDPGDSILAAEVAAAGRLIDGLDPRSTRVGLVSFAGDPHLVGSGQLRVRRAALSQEPLTSDFKRLHRGLEEISARGPRGGTYMAAGMDLATLELLGLPGALSVADPDSEKLILFFTDGEPTLPHPDVASNVREVLRSAIRSWRAGVRIHSFAIGPEALAGPISTVEMAKLTHGIFTPVRDPANLGLFVEGLSLANIAKLEVRNLSNGRHAYQVSVHPDGSWDALVPLQEGSNEVEVRATSVEGAEATARIHLQDRPGGKSSPLPAELISRHNELLEDRLRHLEWERVEATRKELVIEMEKERTAAVERAARQRKELNIEVEALRPSTQAPPSGPR